MIGLALFPPTDRDVNDSEGRLRDCVQDLCVVTAKSMPTAESRDEISANRDLYIAVV
jgi:hypothetical protein